MHIQAIHVHNDATQIVFGDELFVTFDLNGKLAAIGQADAVETERAAVMENESATEFVGRALNDIAGFSAYSHQDIMDRVVYAESCLDQPWIENKRKRLFGSAS